MKQKSSLKGQLTQRQGNGLKQNVDKIDLTDMYRTSHPKATEYTSFSSTHGTCSRFLFGMMKKFWNQTVMTVAQHYKGNATELYTLKWL